MTPTSDPSVNAAALEEFAGRLAGAGLRVRRDVAIGALTTYRVGGHAAIALDAARPDDLRRIGSVRGDLDVPVVVIGRGSNLLVADGGFAGLSVTLGDDFAAIDVDGDRVTAGGAASLPVVARRTAAAGLTGFEWAVGVPGSIGGAVRMNAGGHGSDMAACTERVRVIDLADGEDVEVTVDDLAFGYRRSAIASTQVVVEATLRLRPGIVEQSESEISEIVRWRREHQPGGANAGSVFTNPEGDSAGRLIDAAGCRGLRVGTAEVSDKHANFIQADPDGNAGDVVALMAEVRRRVADVHGVDLRAETRLVGFDRAMALAAGAES